MIVSQNIFRGYRNFMIDKNEKKVFENYQRSDE